MNESIKEYCKSFIDSPTIPQFAIFIKGDWGSGKTFFIDSLIKEYTKNNKSRIKESQIIKISLFGVGSYEDIDTKIYQAVHPILSSEGMKIAGAITRTALKLGTNIDFNNDGKNDISLTLGGTPARKGKKAKNIDKKLLIVDDFERALLKPTQIFGYFSELITESETKVIFIGNEEKISDADKAEYHQIKEKTIGIEFKIEPNRDTAIQTFIKELNITQEKTIIKCLEDISSVIECNNLRIIRLALYNLKLFLDLINNFMDENDKKDIINIFLVLFIQKNLNEIHSEDDILDTLTAYFKYHKSYKQYLEYKEKNKDDKYFFLSSLNYVPISNVWDKLIFDGYYNREWIKNIYQREKNERLEENNKKELSNLFKLYKWSNLTKEDFEYLVKKVFEEFKSGEYLFPGDILHFANLMIILAKRQLIPNTTDEIKNTIKKFIEDFKDKIVSISDWSVLMMGYAGYVYNTEISDVNEIAKELQSFNSENVKRHAQIDINNDMYSLLPNDIELFCKNIIHVNGNHKYYKQPILSYLDINKFFEVFKSLPHDDQKRILSSLSERYGLAYSNEPFEKEYALDYENLNKLRNLYEKDIGDIMYNPQEFQKKEILGNLNSLVSYVEKKKNQISLPR